MSDLEWHDGAEAGPYVLLRIADADAWLGEQGPHADRATAASDEADGPVALLDGPAALVLSDAESGYPVATAIRSESDQTLLIRPEVSDDLDAAVEALGSQLSDTGVRLEGHGPLLLLEAWQTAADIAPRPIQVPAGPLAVWAARTDEVTLLALRPA